MQHIFKPSCDRLKTSSLRTFKNILFGVTLLSLISGCAVRPTAQSLRIQETNFYYLAINKCKYLGHARRVSGWGGIAANVGLRNAKTAIKEDAVKMGGTHIVWTSFDIDNIPLAETEVFVCGSGFAAPIFDEDKK